MPISWYLLAVILDFDSMIMIIMLIIIMLMIMLINNWIVLLSILLLLLLRMTSLPYSEQLILLLSIANFLEKIDQVAIIRSRISQVFFKIGVLKHFAIFIGKHLCCSLQVQIYCKETRTQVFSCKYSKILKNSFLYSILLASFYFTK